MADGVALGPVRIAWSEVDSEVRAVESTLRRLGGTQLRRHQNLDSTQARRFTTGRLLLAALIPELISTDSVRLTSICEQCGGDHGRPQVEGAPFAVSVSYAGDMVVAAAVALESASALGIDMEPRSGSEDAPLSDLARLFAPRAPPGLREWTAIEAAVKADGRGLRIPPSDVTFGERSSLLLPDGQTVQIPGRDNHVEVAAAPGPPGHVVSVAVISAVPGAAAHPARRGRGQRAARQ